MADIDRKAHTEEDFHAVHMHTCPECGTSYSCNCSQNDRKEVLVCITCEREGR